MMVHHLQVHPLAAQPEQGCVAQQDVQGVMRQRLVKYSQGQPLLLLSLH